MHLDINNLKEVWIASRADQWRGNVTITENDDDREAETRISKAWKNEARYSIKWFGSQVAYSKFPFFSRIYLTNDRIDKHNRRNLKNQKPEKLLLLPIFHLPIENLAYIYIYITILKRILIFRFEQRNFLSLIHSFIH